MVEPRAGSVQSEDSGHDRRLHVMLGVFYGDCLGAQYEFGRPNPDRSLEIGWSAFGHPPGSGTDDTETTLAVAHGLLVAAGIGNLNRPEESIANRLLAWFDTGPADVGNTTRRGLETYRVTGNALTSGGLGIRSISNGSLMRSAPFVLAYADVEQAAEVAASSSCTTHRDPVVLDCVRVYVRLLGQTLNRDIEVPTSTTAEVRAALTDAQDALHDLPTAIATPGIGYAPYCLALAAWAAWSPLATDYATGIEHIIRVGGDTDTNAAVAGAVLAARHGFPPALAAPLDPQRVLELRTLAERLIALRQS